MGSLVMPEIEQKYPALRQGVIFCVQYQVGVHNRARFDCPTDGAGREGANSLFKRIKT